jgi:ADP-heptose:LPS heptosyltransferase
METVLERLPDGARVTLVRLRSLGDCVLTTPAIALLKAHRPDLRLSVVVEPRFRAVFENNPAIEDLLPGHPRPVARSKPRLLVNLHGGTTSIMLTLASRAPLRAGFAHFRAQAAYNVRIPTAQEILGVDRTVHTAEHLASAVFYLGVPRQEIPRARIFSKIAARPAPYAVLHPFASSPEKTWPGERFQAVARSLERAGVKPLVLCGRGESPGVVPGVEAICGMPLAESIALIRGAALFVGNDSGPAHVAAACATPLVVLFGASDPEVWAPWKAPEAAQIVRPGIAEIQVEDVLAAIDRVGVRA